ncbi:MAG: hypothetical protein J5781_04490 [Clostridia bacterium]|nr:hypothetical protein [Clostridia bacterium]
MKEKEQSTVLSSDNIQEIAAPYMERQKDFIDLAELKEPRDLEIALFCLNHKRNFLAELDINNPSHMKILKNYVNRNYSNYLILSNYNLENEELFAIYLYRKFIEAAKEKKTISVMRSYDKKTVLCYRYETKKGETIAYFDKMLGVPTVLKVTADLKIKVVGPEKLLQAVDVEVNMIDLGLTGNYIDTIVGKYLRDTILGYLQKNDLTYYLMPQHYTAIGDEVKKTLNKTFGEAGLEICDLNILDITIPNNTNEMFERQFFAIAEAERVKDYEYRMENAALDLYAKKAEIHSKYPDFPVTLTESEKDFALNRYLKRIGVDTDLSVDIKSDELADREKQGIGTLTKTKMAEPIAPKEPKKPNAFRKVFFALLTVCILVSVIMLIVMLPIGLICLGVTILLFGVLASVKWNALKVGKSESKAYNEYKKQYEDYKAEYALYLESKDNNRTAK